MRRRSATRSIPMHLEIARAFTALALVVAAATAQAVRVDQEAPDFTLATLEGPNLRLQEYRGQVVLIRG